MVDVVVYGSCTTRDTLEFYPPKGMNLRGYIARQSWASVENVCDLPLLTNARFQSAFVDRNFQGDLQGDALRRIRQQVKRHPHSHLLIDLTDERGGFWSGPDGQIATYNYNALQDGLYKRMPTDWRHIPFGSLGYGMALLEASQRMRVSLEKMGVWDRTYVLASRWAENTEDGTQTGISMGHSAKEANTLYDDYYQLLAAEGWNLLEPDIADPIAAQSHKWGQAPFHYEDSYYRSLSQAISRGLRN